MTTTRHLSAVDPSPEYSGDASPPPDVEGIAQSLTTLVDLGRAIAARAALLIIADDELALAGQRVEWLAARTFELIFEAPVGTPIEQL